MAVNGEDIVPGIGKKQAAVLNNESARRLEHERHLEELGFPKYVEPGYMRHAPVSYDDPDNPTPSRIVNQAGQDLGDQNKDESDHFAKNTYKPAKKLAKEAFLDFMAKDAADGLPEFDEYGNVKVPDVAITNYGNTDEAGNVTLRGDLNPAELQAEAKAKEDIASMQTGQFDLDSIQEASFLAPDPDTGEITSYKYYNPDSPILAANQVDPSIRGTMQDPNYKPPSFTLSSIEKSMNLFSNLMKDEMSEAAEEGKQAVKDIGTAAGERALESFYEGVQSLLSGEAIGRDFSEEDADKSSREVKEEVEEKIKEETTGVTPETKLKINFPTYAQYKSKAKEPTPAGYVDYARRYAEGFDQTYRELYPESVKRITEKIKVTADDPDAVGVPLRFQPGQAGTVFGRGGSDSYITEFPEVGPRGEEIKPPPPEKPEGPEYTYDPDSSETEFKGTEVFMPRIINETEGKDVPSTSTYTLDIKPPDQINIPNVPPEKKEEIINSALQSIGLQGSGNVNRFAYTPPPASPQRALQISPDQRMPLQMRADLAQAAFDREVARLTAGAKNVTKMEKYQAWIQKAEDEGAMAKVQLDRVSDLADMMHDALDEEDQLPGWIQNKISDSLHNLEASFTHIAYDKKQDMELSKSKETFTNILQKDNHTSSYRGFVTEPGLTGLQPTAAQQTGALATTASGFKDIDPKRFKGKLGPVTGILEIGEKLYAGNNWLQTPETAGKLKKYGNKAFNYATKLAGAGSKGPVLGIAAVAASGYLGKKAIDAVSPKASEETRQTIQDMASGFISNPVSFLAGDASAMPRKKDGSLYETKDITSALKDFGANLFKEDISLQKDEGGFDAFGRPTTPAITPKPDDTLRREAKANPFAPSETQRKRLIKLRMHQIVPQNVGVGIRRALAAQLKGDELAEYTKLAAELGEAQGGGRGPAAVPKDFDQLGRDVYRGEASKPKPGFGEVPDYKPVPETAAERIAKIKRMAENPNITRFRGDTITGQGALKAGSKRGTIDTMYDQLLDQPKTSLGSGMEQPKAFGKNPTMAYERVSGARGDKFLAPPTKREISEVLDQVADWSQSKVKTAARGALKGKKGLLSALGAAGLGTAFNYLQDKGSDLLGDGGNTRVQ